MALTLSAIRLLTRADKRKPFEGPLLTLGRQGIYGTLDQCREAIASQGVEPHPLGEGVATGTNVPAFQASPTMSGFTSDVAAFRMMCGQAPETLDVSDYEQADHIHDLNRPAPDHLVGRFGTIIDGGTLEHVFDVPQTLRNMKAMLRPGGRIIHINPMNNWSEHGFYQLSPTLYHDFYATNGFRMIECLVVATTLANTESLYIAKSKAWRWTPARPSAAIVSKDMLTAWFEAEKAEETGDHVPHQGEAASGTSSSQLGGVKGGGTALNRLREKAVGISPAAGRLVLLGKKLLRRDLSSEPWGLEYVGRF